jgi:hypothetical protein
VDPDDIAFFNLEAHILERPELLLSAGPLLRRLAPKPPPALPG